MSPSAGPKKRHHMSNQTSTTKRAQAFSLIEFIGVLAVIAILAALVTPAAIRQIDAAARTREASDLVAISNALTLHILQNKSVPSTTTWKDVAAQWMQQPVARITTTPRGQARAFIIDGGGWLGSTTLPWSQSRTGLTTLPSSPRVLIVSSISKPLPVSSGQFLQIAFDEIWNTPDRAKPASWSGWTGTGDDLLIQRVNLQPLFHRLVVVNRDASAVPPRVSIDNFVEVTNTIPILSSSTGLDAYYLNGSIVGLCNATATPVRRFVLTRDTGCVFEGKWRDDLGGGGGSNEEIAQEFAALAARFLAAQWYPGATQGGRTGTQQGALTAMFNFMLVYSLWADPFPHFNRHGANANQVPEYILLDDLVGSGQGATASGFLNVFTGPGGLLN